MEDESGRIRVYQGRQEDAELLNRIARENAPEGFDIIIDDCSHVGALTRASFRLLFDEHLKSGGVYVVEDWGTGYWDDWVDGVSYEPPKRSSNTFFYRTTRALSRLQNNGTLARLPFVRKLLRRAKAASLKRQFHSHDFGMVGFVKELIDELGAADITHPEHGRARRRASKIREMHVSQSHLFIFKN